MPAQGYVRRMRRDARIDGIRCGDCRCRPFGAVDRDPPAPAGRTRRARAVGAWWRRARKSAPTFSRVRWSSRARSTSHSRLEGTRCAAQHAGAGRPLPAALRQGARKLPTRRRCTTKATTSSARQPVPLARRAGRSARVEIYPGFAAAEVLFDDAGSVRASPPVTWGDPRGRARPQLRPGGSSCMHARRCSRKAAAARSPRG